MEYIYKEVNFTKYCPLPEVTYGEICYALLKSGNKLTDEEQKIFDNYRKTGQLEMMSDDNIDDWEDTK